MAWSEEVEVDQRFVGLLIGPGGLSLRQIKQESGAKSIQLDQSTSHRGFSTLHVHGGARAVRMAMKLVEQKISGASDRNPRPRSNCSGAEFSWKPAIIHEGLETMTVDQRWVGKIIGPAGETLRSIEMDSGAKLVFDQGTWDQGYSSLHITGSWDAISAAKRLVKSSQTPASKEHSEAAIEIRVHQEYVGLVIGRGGQELQRIHDDTGAVVKVDQSTRDQGYSTFSILPCRGASLARELITGKIQKATAAEEAIDEMVIDQLDVGMLIGRSGDTISHISTQSGAHVVFDQSTGGQGYSTLRIRGSQDSIEKARGYVQQMLAHATAERGQAQTREKKTGFLVSNAGLDHSRCRVEDLQASGSRDDSRRRFDDEEPIALDAWHDDDDIRSSSPASEVRYCIHDGGSSSVDPCVEDEPNSTSRKDALRARVDRWSMATSSQYSQKPGSSGPPVTSQLGANASVSELAPNDVLAEVAGGTEALEHGLHCDVAAKAEIDTLFGAQDIDDCSVHSADDRIKHCAANISDQAAHADQSPLRPTNKTDEEFVTRARTPPKDMSALGADSAVKHDGSAATSECDDTSSHQEEQSHWEPVHLETQKYRHQRGRQGRSQLWPWSHAVQRSSSEPRSRGPACCYFLKGWCKHGAKCWLRHDEDDDPDYTICSFGERCVHRHGWAVRQSGSSTRWRERRRPASSEVVAKGWGREMRTRHQWRPRQRSASPPAHQHDVELWQRSPSLEFPMQLGVGQESRNGHLQRGIGDAAVNQGNCGATAVGLTPGARCSSKRLLRAADHDIKSHANEESVALARTSQTDMSASPPSSARESDSSAAASDLDNAWSHEENTSHLDQGVLREIQENHQQRDREGGSQLWPCSHAAQRALSEPRGSGPACCYFLQGRCKHGARCWLRHAVDDDPDYTICAFGGRCEHRHGWALKQGGSLSRRSERGATGWGNMRASRQCRPRQRSTSPLVHQHDVELQRHSSSVDFPTQRGLGQASANERHQWSKGQSPLAQGDSGTTAAGLIRGAHYPSKRLVRVALHALLGSWHGREGNNNASEHYEVAMGSAPKQAGCAELTCQTWQGDVPAKAKEPVRFDGSDIVLGEHQRLYLDTITTSVATWVNFSPPGERLTWRRSIKEDHDNHKTTVDSGLGPLASCDVVSPIADVTIRFQ